MSRITTRLVLWLLRHADLSVEDRNLCTGALLDNLQALPLASIITTSDEGIFINGEPLDVERASTLRETARVALDNIALNLIWQQVRWVGVVQGLAKGLPDKDLLFYRAAMWFSDQMKSQLQILAQRSPELPS